MKKIILFLFLSTLNFNVYCQLAELPFGDNQKIKYEGIVEVKKKSKSELYNDAKEYILMNYTNKGYPTLIDETNERIYVKGTFKVPFRKWYFPFIFKTTIYDEIYTLKLYFKEGRFRYEITEINIQRKTNARATGYYWGSGVTTTTLKQSEVITNELEKYYIPRYRKKKYKLFQSSDNSINKEISKLTYFLRKENKMNDW